MELDVVDLTSCTRPLRYDSNQSSTASFRPYDVFSRCRSVSWSILSNAADMSCSETAWNCEKCFSDFS